jgi:hypothetical protein
VATKRKEGQLIDCVTLLGRRELIVKEVSASRPSIDGSSEEASPSF